MVTLHFEPVTASDLALQNTRNAGARFSNARRVFDQRETEVLVAAGAEADSWRDRDVRGLQEFGRCGK